MAESQVVERKLAAIFAADVVGYSQLMEQDEIGTLRALRASRAILDRLIADYRGRIFTTAGDSVLADFASAVDAVECALAVQEELALNKNYREGIQKDAAFFGAWLPSATDQELTSYFDRIKIFGEREAMRWIRDRRPDLTPP